MTKPIYHYNSTLLYSFSRLSVFSTVTEQYFIFLPSALESILPEDVFIGSDPIIIFK